MTINTRLIVPCSAPFLRAVVAACAAAAATPGCAVDELPSRHLGDTSDLLVSSPEEGSTSGERLDVVKDGRVDPFIVGDWVGQAEDIISSTGPDGERPTYTFPSGSSEIRLHLELENGFSPQGDISFGAGPAPEPLPGVAFPPGLNYYYGSFSFLEEPLIPPIEGYAYPLSEVIVRIADGNGGGVSGALVVSYVQNAPFQDWCPIQPSLPEGDGDFNCIGAIGLAGGDPEAGQPCTVSLADGSRNPIDCNLATLCLPRGGVCDCAEDGCVARESHVANHLWLLREGDELIGNLVSSVFDYGDPGRFMPVGSIRFQRVSP